MITVQRYIGETTLNGTEHLLDDENNIMVFDTIDNAVGFLQDNGIDMTKEEILDTFIIGEEDL